MRPAELRSLRQRLGVGTTTAAPPGLTSRTLRYWENGQTGMRWYNLETYLEYLLVVAWRQERNPQRTPYEQQEAREVRAEIVELLTRCGESPPR